jgi:hypothetical protein
MNQTELMVNIARKMRKNKNFKMDITINMSVKNNDEMYEQENSSFKGIYSLKPQAFQLEAVINEQKVYMYLDEKKLYGVFDGEVIKMGKDQRIELLKGMQIDELAKGIDKLIIYAEDLNVIELESGYNITLPEDLKGSELFDELEQTVKVKDPEIQLVEYKYELSINKDYDLETVIVSATAVKEDDVYGKIEVETEIKAKYFEHNTYSEIKIPREIVEKAEE